MKKNLKYLGWALIVGLIFAPSLGFADFDLSKMFNGISFPPPQNDYSVSFLVKLFGFVPGVSQTVHGSPTLISKIFSVLNAAIISIAGVFLTYNVVRYITETTMEGQPMARSGSIWTAVRAAMSVSFLVPQASGYSLINGIVMWAVMQGIGLADVTWNTALTFLHSGHPTFSAATQLVDYTLVAPGKEGFFTPDYWEKSVPDPYALKNQMAASSNANDQKSVFAADILRSLVCAYTVENALKKNQKDNLAKVSALKLAPGDQSPEASALVNGNREISGQLISPYQFNSNDVEFPYIKGDITQFGLKSGSYPKGGTPPGSQLSGACGKYTWTTGGGSQAMLAAKKQGLMDMVASLSSTAKELVTQADKLDTKSASGRGLDPFNFVVSQSQYHTTDNGTDSTPLYLYNINNKRPDSWDQMQQDIHLEDMSVYQLRFGSQGDGTKTIINGEPNWPIGAASLLSAAAAYQASVFQVMNDESSTINKDLDGDYAASAADGWINAGAYYKLLYNTENKIKLIWQEYRSQPVDSSVTRGDKPYFDIFNLNKPTLQISGGSSQSLIDWLDSISPGTRTTMALAFEQIFYSAPYAPLLGEMHSPSSANEVNSTVGGSSFVSDIDFGVIVGAEAIDAAGLIVEAAAALTATGSPYGTGILAATSVPPSIITATVYFLQIATQNVQWATQKELMMDNDHSPVLKEMNIGQAMINSAAGYWVAISGMTSSMSIASTIANFMSTEQSWSFASTGSIYGIMNAAANSAASLSAVTAAASKIVSDFMYIFVPIGFAVTAPMFTCGVILTTYVPMIPFIVFLFGVIGWFASILVFMAAAPLVCFFVLWSGSTGDNPFFTREVEQFVMQLIGLFLQPTLMILGLCAAMMISDIALSVFNLGFNHLYPTITKDVSSGFTDLIVPGALFAARTYFVFAIIQACSRLIVELPDSVKRVAHIDTAGQDFGTQMSRQAEEMVQSGISRLSAESGAKAGESVASKNASGSGLSSTQGGKTKKQQMQENPPPEPGKKDDKKGAGG